MKIEYHCLEAYEKNLKQAALELKEKSIVKRILKKDYSVWKNRNEEISSRLGWLDTPIRMKAFIQEYHHLAETVKKSGIKKIVLLGMGGSSLAPETLSEILTRKEEYPRLIVLDSTCPTVVSQVAETTKSEASLFLVSSKSGITVETLSLLNYFYHQQKEIHGNRAGQYFMAITDPGTPLEKLASELGFRMIVQGFPDVGGRFSALSPFGLFPAALIGIDLEKLLLSADETILEFRTELDDHPGVKLGLTLGCLNSLGMDKVTLLLPPSLKSLGRWLEQLAAESTGKEGRGILPVIESLPHPEEAYGQDRIFVLYNPVKNQDIFWQKNLERFTSLNHPLIHFSFTPEEISGHFFTWELAIAVAGYFLKINPFDQPDVELTKKKTRELLKKPQDELSPGIFLDQDSEGFSGEFESFLLRKNHKTEYIAVLAFLPQHDNLEVALDNLCRQLAEKTKLPCVWNYGPAYLHSTGQLHKGDAGNGKYLGLLFQQEKQLPIPSLPGSPAPAFSFNQLFEAQALADFEALKEKGRRLLPVRINERPVEEIFRLGELVRNM